MITEEQIKKNITKWYETGTKNGFLTEELFSFLGSDFMKAPASSMLDYNNAFDGGLVEHLLKTASYAVRINSSLPDDEKVDQKSLLKVCLLHQIGKAKLYTTCTSQWHRDKQGKMYEFNEDLVSMRVGERSVYYALSHGVTFTEEEFSAIIFFDKVDDRMSDYHNSMLGELLKMGSILAIKNEQKKLKLNGQPSN